jgi:hypothetical protein
LTLAKFHHSANSASKAMSTSFECRQSSGEEKRHVPATGAFKGSIPSLLSHPRFVIADIEESETGVCPANVARKNHFEECSESGPMAPVAVPYRR